MNSATAAERIAPLKYATTFEDRILGVKCDIEVAIDLSENSATVVAAMRQPLRSSPSCHVSIDDLEALKTAIHQAREKAQLLESLPEGAADHQLNCSWSSATLIVVRPPSRPARFTLTIGQFHREGPLEELSSKDVDAALTKLNDLRARVLAKVAK